MIQKMIPKEGQQHHRPHPGYQITDPRIQEFSEEIPAWADMPGEPMEGTTMRDSRPLDSRPRTRRVPEVKMEHPTAERQKRLHRTPKSRERDVREIRDTCVQEKVGEIAIEPNGGPALQGAVDLLYSDFLSQDCRRKARQGPLQVTVVQSIK